VVASQDVLEIYGRDGALVRIIAMTRDEHDLTKWHLAESVSLGDTQSESAVLRFRDGTSEPLTASMFASSAPINTIFL